MAETLDSLGTLAAEAVIFASSVKTDPKEKAKAMFIKGVAIADIARRLGVNRSTVTRWKKSGNWDALADSLPEEPQRPKLVSFDRDRERPKRQEVPNFEVPNLNTLEGQLEAIDRLVGIALREAAHPQSPQTFSSALNAVPKLLMERRSVLPIDRTALMLALMERYRDPADLLEDLKRQGWGRKAS